MNICLSCGAVFDDNEAEYKRHSGTYDRDGGCIDPPSSEELCPECGSDDFTEATECMICGEYFEEDLHHVCPKCRAELSTTENAIKFGDCEEYDCKKEVKLNGFLATIFTPEQINAILAREYVATGEDHEAQEEFCGNDGSDEAFADFIKRRLEKIK